jgi:CYTH domain-containing protein
MALEIERKYLVIDESWRAGVARTALFRRAQAAASRAP